MNKKLNIGFESSQEKIDKRGVSLLRKLLEESDKFETHLKDEDKTPNTDGYFIIRNKHKTEPLRRFDVQIKSTIQNVECLQNGNVKFQIDTKFFNYANLKVTTDPCIVFYIDLKKETIYFKVLTDEYLSLKESKFTQQETISIHFNPAREKVDDLDSFYKTLLNITFYRKEFTIKGIDILEYQKGFDILNNFFDNDFSIIKKTIFPGVWKFGIAYQRYPFDSENRKPSTLNGASYDTCFGVYKIMFGEKTLPFQQAEIESKETKLNFIGSIIKTFSIKETVDAGILNWIEEFTVEFINQYLYTIPFLPNDALYEILFNAVMVMNPNFNNKSILISDFERLYFEKHNMFVLDDKNIISLSLRVLKRRNLDTIHAVFEPYNNNFSLLDERNIQIRIKNNKKLFDKMPSYYQEFILNLFGESNYSSFQRKHDYYYKLDIYSDNNLIVESYSYSCCKSDELKMKEVDSFDDQNTIRGGGVLDTDFRNNGVYNITFGLLNLLHKSICEEYRFIDRGIEPKSCFKAF